MFVEKDDKSKAFLTARFLNLFNSLLKCLNIKATEKGFHKNDGESVPFRSFCDPRLEKVYN